MATVLTLHEQEELAKAERIVRAGLTDAIDVERARDLISQKELHALAVARALHKIHHNGWYKCKHSSFEAYLHETFNCKLSRGYAYRLIQWAKASDMELSPMGDTLKERQFRELQGVPQEIRGDVLEAAKQSGDTSIANISKIAEAVLTKLPEAKQIAIAERIQEANAKRGIREIKPNKTLEEYQDECEKHVAALRKIAGRIMTPGETKAANRKLDSFMEMVRAKRARKAA